MRRLTLEDADLMLAVWNDPAFYKYVGDRGIRTREQAQEAMAAGALQLYENYGYGPFRVALRESDQPIGIGYWNQLIPSSEVQSSAVPRGISVMVAGLKVPATSRPSISAIDQK